MGAGYDGSIQIDTKLDSSGFNRGMKGMAAGMGGVSGGIGSIMSSLRGLAAAVGLAFGAAAIISFGKGALAAASNVEEATNKFAVVFKGLAGGVEGELAAYSKAVNRSKYDLMGFAATLQDTFVPLGFARDQAAQMSVQVVKLATDLGSFNNLDTADVVRDLQSALVGNTETLRKYGVVANQAQIEAKALALGLWSGKGAMTAQAKASAILQLALSGNADAQGDAARTANSYANQMRGLQATWSELQVAVGNALQPAILQVLPYIKSALEWLTALASQAAMFMQALFGVGAQTSAAADSTQAAADAAQNLTDNTKSASKAAKGALAAFDQLNVLQQQETVEPVSIPEVAATGKKGAEDQADAIFEAMKKKVEAFRSELEKLFGPASQSFERLTKALEPLGKKLWEGLQWAWDNILVPLGKWAITEALPRFLDMLTEAAGYLNIALDALKPVGIWLWENFLQPLASFSGEAIINLLDLMALYFERISKGIKEGGFWGGFKAAWAFMGEAMTAILGKAWDLILKKFGEAGPWFRDNVTVPVTQWFEQAWASIQKSAADAWDQIGKAWNAAGEWFRANVTDPIADLFSSAWANLRKLADDAWANLQKTWASAGDWFSAKVVSPIRDFFAGGWANIKQSAATGWANIQSTWSSASDWFKSNVTGPIGSWFGNAWTDAQTLASSTWANVQSTWASAGDWFKTNVTSRISDWFSSAWADTKSSASSTWSNVQSAWSSAGEWFRSNVTGPIGNWFSSAWTDAKDSAADSWANVQSKWAGAGEWFRANVTDGIKSAFSDALDWVGEKWRTVFDDIPTFVKNGVNTVIDFMNSMIGALTDGINSVIGALNALQVSIPSWVPGYGGSVWGMTLPYVSPTVIPHLATGAVIPPNAQFAAVLGDQRNGRNLEAPEALIRQIVREETQTNPQSDIVVRFEGSLASFVRELKPHIDRESRRVGKSLITAQNA